jgi:hypothetical protein
LRACMVALLKSLAISIRYFCPPKLGTFVAQLDANATLIVITATREGVIRFMAPPPAD